MKRYVKTIIVIVLALLVVIMLSRQMSPREIDDVHPDRPCEVDYLEKSDILWIMPFFENTSIATNKSWCAYIKSLNKTIGMHGVTHSEYEFIRETITKEEINKSLEAIKECVGFYPTMFKAPHLKISKENKEIIELFNLELRTPYHQTIHKVYHCNEAGTFPNKFHDLI